MYDKRKIFAAAAAAAVMLSCSGLPVQAAEDSDKLRVMCLGDSITDGFWLTGGYRNTLCTRITENGLADAIDFVGPNWGIVTADGYDPNHAGYSGYAVDNIAQEDSISGGRVGISSLIDGILAQHHPDVVLLQIGTNDILSLYDLEHFGERLGGLVDTILGSLPPDGMLYLATLPVMDANDATYISPYSFTVDSMDAAVESCNAQIRALCSQKRAEGKRIQLAEINKLLTKADLKDGVHPSEAGYAKMGEFWFQKLLDYRAGKFDGEEAEQTVTTPAQIIPLAGDVNGDGAVTVADAVRLVRHLTTAELLTEEEAGRADLDGNRRINAADLTLLKRKLI